MPTTIERAAERPQGWSYAVTLAANLNLSSNRDVVGQVEGNSFLVGGSALAGASYLRDRHELLNTGALNEAWSRTPTLDRFVKSNDLLELQSLYNYFLNTLTGPFARLALQTSIMKTDRVTSQPVTYTRDGVATETATSSRFRLSDAGQPFTLSESVGWFVQPVRSGALNLQGRLGFGGRHTWADGARAITDADDEPTNVVYSVLSDVHQAGAELFAGFDGKQFEGKLIYSAGLTTLFPFLNNDNSDRSILELTRVALTGAVGFGVLSWLSLNYQLRVLRDPQLVEAVQVQNALLISLQYTRSSPTPSAAKKEETISPETQARITELETRAAAAEQRAREAEARIQGTSVPPEPPPSIDPPATSPDAAEQPVAPRVPVPGP